MKMNWWKWTAMILTTVFLALALLTASTTRWLGPTKEYNAAQQARHILIACEAYRKPEEPANTYPTTLDDLIPLLKNGGDDLIDPWGNPLHYAVLPNSKGELEPHVWAERVVDGKLKRIGAKLKADEKIEYFGLK